MAMNRSLGFFEWGGWGGTTQVQGQPEQLSKSLSQNKKTWANNMAHWVKLLVMPRTVERSCSLSSACISLNTQVQ